tara:strand:+ start:718 stop:1248 length:531 start_codon:yes stop_codon:yes gene_type:complete
MNKKSVLFICFLIFSCDLPNEANTDCNGIKDGNAYIDDCGQCVGGNTGIDPNSNKNLCGECYGPILESCTGCGSSNAINYNEKADDSCIAIDCIEEDESLCIYDMCTDYLPNSLSQSEYTCDASSGSNTLYNIGDQLRCSDVEEVYSIAYPENCNNTFKLADFYGKAIYILIETSW